nr:unnamed protein product [Spirometra erinaceieuropaei]
MSALSTNMPRADRPRWASTDSKYHPENPNYCLSDRPCSELMTSTPTTTLSTNAQHLRTLPPSSTTISTIPATSSATMTTTTTDPIHASDQNLTITAPICSDMNSVLACRQWDRSFARRIGLADHLRMHSTATGGPTSEAFAN